MYRLFGSTRVQPLEANPRELLRSFVTELDVLISRHSISVINDPAPFPINKIKRLASYIDYGLKSLTFLQGTPAFRIRTSNSVLFSRTAVNSEEDPIHLC